MLLSLHDLTHNTRRQPRYAYIAPLYRQAKAIAWDMLSRYASKFEDTVINQAELRVDFPNGGQLRLYGADNPDSLRGIYLDGVVFDEYAQMRPRVWHEVVRPALSDRAGWAVFIGTPYGKNHFHDLYQQAQSEPDWHAALYTVEDTGVIPEDELESARRIMAPEQYAQEWMCSFESALIGSYYGAYLETALSETRITRVPWDPSVPCHTCWDLGINDATAIWFVQPVGRMLHVIDYLEASDHGLEWYAKVLKDKPYTYGRHYFPHDIEARDFSSDGRTRLSMAEQLGLRPAVVVPRGDVADGIQAVRSLFPRLLFDSEKCHEGLEALKAYRRAWNETQKTWTEHPLHDWCLTEDTPILTRNGMYQIMDLPITGEVLTSCGWKAYHSPRITRRHAPLVEVVFSDGFTVRCTAEHLFKTADGWISAQHLQPNSVIQSCLIPSRSISMALSTVSTRASATLRKVAAICTAMSGGLSLAHVRTAATSITATGTLPTMPSAISSAWIKQSISGTRWLNVALEGMSRASVLPLEPRPQIGTRLRKDGYGIAGMRSEARIGRSGNVWQSRALIVAGKFRHWCVVGMRRSIVVKHAAMRRITSGKSSSMRTNMSLAPVSIVAPSLPRLKNVVGIVNAIVAGLVTRKKQNSDGMSDGKPPVLRVVQVTPLTERADVWCLTVPELEEFALANGALVHNSSHSADAIRCFAMGYGEDTPVLGLPTLAPGPPWARQAFWRGR